LCCSCIVAPVLVPGNYPVVTKALTLYLRHVAKGCLSDTEALHMTYARADGKTVTWRGTVKNEALHRWLKEACAKAALVGGAYSSLVQRWQIYHWNASMWAKLKETRQPWLAQTALDVLCMARELYERIYGPGSCCALKDYLLPANLTPAKDESFAYTPCEEYVHDFNSTKALAGSDGSCSTSHATSGCSALSRQQRTIASSHANCSSTCRGLDISLQRRSSRAHRTAFSLHHNYP